MKKNYDLVKTMHDIERLRELLAQENADQQLVIQSFKEKYPYTSSDESMIAILSNQYATTKLIAKMLIMECRHEGIDEYFLEQIDKLSRN